MRASGIDANRFKVSTAALSGALAATFALGGAQASAQVLEQASAASPATDQVAEIIVTAGKREEKLSKVADGISVVTSQQLTVRSADSLQDYIAFTPGVSINSYGNAGHGVVSIRGISPQSVGATTATYVDDIPVGPSSAATRGSQFTVDLDPNDLDRVEVLKGPQGTLYGASSMGGVLHYVTRAPSLTSTELDTSEELNQIDGGFGGVKVRAAGSTPLVDGVLGIRASGYYRYSGGYIHDIQFAGPGANASRDWGFRASLLYKPTSNLSIRLDALNQHDNGDGASTVDYAKGSLDPTYGNLKEKRYIGEPFTVKTQLYDANVNWNLGFGTLLSATGYSKFDTAVLYDGTGLFGPAYGSFLPIGPSSPIGRFYDGRVKKTTEELRFTSKRLGAFEFIAGGFYQHENLFESAGYQGYTSAGNVAPNALYGHNLRYATFTEYAGFVNATAYLTDRLDITGGYRYSQLKTSNEIDATGIINNRTNPTAIAKTVNGSNENSNTYLASVRWQATDGVLFYARAASGYRPGGGRPIPVGAPPGFPGQFESDSLWSYEAGTKVRAWNGRLTLDFDGFWIDWSNIQTIQPVGPIGTTDGNAGHARSKGLEFQTAFVPTHGLTIGGNLAYTDARFRDSNAITGVFAGEHLYYVPTWTGAAYVEYEKPVNDKWSLDAGVDWAYRSSQLDANHITLPGYAVWNLHVGGKTGHFGINFYVNNLTNKRGLTGSEISSSTSLAYYPFSIIQPRTFGIVFSQKY
jgi:outer membrane receptor protein involved in Fe transport